MYRNSISGGLRRLETAMRRNLWEMDKQAKWRDAYFFYVGGGRIANI